MKLRTTANRTKIAFSVNRPSEMARADFFEAQTAHGPEPLAL